MRNGRTSFFGLLSGGFVIVLPILLLGLVVQKMFSALREVVGPVLDAMPGAVFQHRSARFLAVCVTMAALLALIGRLAQTQAGKAIGTWIDARILGRLPFYGLLRGLVSGLAAGDDERTWRAALITVDAPGLQQLGFILERHPDGGATVFLPSSPNPASGTVVIVDESRIRELRIPGRKILACLGRWGAGAEALLKLAGKEADAGGGSVAAEQKERGRHDG